MQSYYDKIKYPDLRLMSPADPVSLFFQERESAIMQMANDKELTQKSIEWMLHADKYKYTYNYTWMGRPIIKYPNDIVIQQEIMWDIKPDLIIETGIAHGGSIILSAALQRMMGIDGEVVGIDIDIRQHNRIEIENHMMFSSITMYEHDSSAESVVSLLEPHLKDKKCIMVILDSLHTHDHVLKELELLSPLVSQGSYLVLPDTFIEFFPKGYYSNRPWDVGNNPYTAMQSFLSSSQDFVVDKKYSSKAQITEAISGYLQRIR